MEFPGAYFINAQANYKLGNLEIAEERAKTGQRLDLEHAYPQIYLIMANISAKKGNRESFIKGLENYLTYAPDAPDAAAIRERLQEALKKDKEEKTNL